MSRNSQPTAIPPRPICSSHESIQSRTQQRIFKQYITIRIDQHNDHTNRITPTEFMEVAKSKYDEMVKAGEWMKQDETERQLVALTAQLEQIDLLNKKLQKKIKENKSNDKSKGKKKKNSKNADKWKWKEVPPKSGQKHTKNFEGKEYHWCPLHKK